MILFQAKLKHSVISIMAILQVLAEPNDILRKKSSPVERVDNSIRKLMDDMLETMYDDKGIGLAANQVGVLKRVIVLDLQDSDDEERPEGFYPLYMANPVIVESSKDLVEADEGCLSVPGQVVTVSRAASVKIQYIDYNDTPKELFAQGWLARVVQHEVDHLDGKLVIDYLSSLKKDVVLRKLAKLQKAASLT